MRRLGVRAATAAAFVRRRHGTTVALCAVLASVVALGHAAAGAYPGANGALVYVKPMGPGDALWLANPDGSGGRPLKSAEFQPIVPSWSPDGTSIAYLDHREGRLHVEGIGGTDDRVLAASTAALTRPSWSPDGSQIAARMLIDGGWRIRVFNADGSGSHEVGTWNLPPDYLQVDDLAWSAQGKFALALSTAESDGRHASLGTMDADGRNLRIILRDLRNPGGLSSLLVSPTWSPDGSRIAFERDGRIDEVDADGSNLRHLTPGPYDGAPAWSPDGNEIVFHRGASYGDSRLVVMAPDGTHRVDIGGGLDPDWQPCVAGRTCRLRVINCRVPKVTGRKVPRARSSLRRAHCTVGRIKRAYAGRKKGIIVAQKPSPGARLKAGGSVALTVSKGQKITRR